MGSRDVILLLRQCNEWLQIKILRVLGSRFLRCECSLVGQWPIDYLVQIVQQILGAGYH